MADTITIIDNRTGKEITVEVKRALQLRAVDAEQAKVDGAKAEAVAKLIAAVEAVPTAVIHSGALLLVKTNDMLTVKDLSPAEIDYLRRNPHSVADPVNVLTHLQVVAASELHRADHLALPSEMGGEMEAESANG